ncbi:MAG: PAS domain-containing sensor histidine kinase [Lysobacterales bacterium]
MMPRPRARFSLAGKLALALALWTLCWLGALILLSWLWPDHKVLILAGLGLLMLCAVLAFSRRLLDPVLALFRALGGTVASYRDNDFSFGIVWRGNDELGDLVDAHNALGDALREQRLGLVQRELLLDSMVQNTPVAMLLIEPGGHIVYANLAARKLLHGGRKLEGRLLADLVADAPLPLIDALASGQDTLYSVGRAGAGDDQAEEEEVVHLARRQFSLNGRPHELLLLRPMTTELRRQEVQTWKKVIRVISHELNNSLAPIASLAHSGGELIRRGQLERIVSIFATIEERAQHLHGFIDGYARFAKLPTPRLEPQCWPALIERLRHQIAFSVVDTLPAAPVRIDAAQVEQALLNVLKNAHESGSSPDQVVLSVRMQGRLARIDIADRGSGMSAAVLASALVPFYSTKHSGTGLGLALTREIIEAHGGSIALANRPGGGLVVSLMLPG